MMNHVPIPTLICIVCALLFAFLTPLLLFLYFKKKADVLPFFVGCLVMFVFAFVIESSLHSFILNSNIGQSILNHALLYALYGGFMAALFEEVGRLIAFKTWLKKYLPNNYNALMYGAGHGGLEVLVVLGITSINNLIYLLLGDQLLATVPTEFHAQINDILLTLRTTPAWMFLLGMVERVFAILLQISLSIFVWLSVKHKKPALFILAFGVHFLVDMITAYLAQIGFNSIALEGVIGTMSILVAFFAYKQFHKYTKEEGVKQ
ncbi:MAG: YhfC family intramembrane metalloprotease [Solobacterium sp.]|nr:YhfC family intramembrane metalloprotease [Solobacterium sp.]